MDRDSDKKAIAKRRNYGNGGKIQTIAPAHDKDIRIAEGVQPMKPLMTMTRTPSICSERFPEDKGLALIPMRTSDKMFKM